MNGMVGIVVKKDGTVPFDNDVPNDVQMHILGYLVTAGHGVKPVKGTRDFKIDDWKGAIGK